MLTESIIRYRKQGLGRGQRVPFAYFMKKWNNMSVKDTEHTRVHTGT